MTEWLIAVIVGVAVGLLLGVKIARDSNKKQPVVGGPLAKTFHYLACAGLTGVLPFVITGLVLVLSGTLLIIRAVSLSFSPGFDSMGFGNSIRLVFGSALAIISGGQIVFMSFALSILGLNIKNK